MDLDLIRNVVTGAGMVVGLAGLAAIYGTHRAQVKAAEARKAIALNPITASLVDDFADALKRKLANAETTHGYSTEWAFDDWELACREKLSGAVKKGDPLDVAAYAAFCWARTWRTTPPATATNA
jgi:hypothetical protein